MRAVAVVCLLLAACGTGSGARGKDAAAPAAPDEQPLARNTVVKADSARIILSDRWRKQAKLAAVAVDEREPGVVVARGGATFRLRGLRVEAREIEVKWLADHEDFLLYAQQVALFHQERKAAYHSTDLSAVAMANDEVSFFQQ